MPRSSRQRSDIGEDIYSMPMTEELANLAAAMNEAHKTNKIPTYQSTISVTREFGTAPERGGCDCAQCLRKSGPLVSELQETIEQITDILGEDDDDGASSSDHGDRSQSSVESKITTRTEAIPQPRTQLAVQLCQHALEQPDPSQLDQLFEECIDADAAGAVADILALPVAQRGHATIIDVLADNGAEFSKLDFHRGGPPLMHAANNGHAATVSALLKRGADISATDRLGQTALMVAVFSDRHQAAEVLIKEGQADLDAEDTMGRTALSHAAKYGSTDCMNLLANCHADVFHKDHDGKTPVQIAEGSLNPRTETVNLLRRYQQLQTIRLRCERKKQKELAQPSQLTPEQQAEAQAKSDAIAEALLAQEAAEKEKALARKVKKKSKVKDVPQTANGIHGAADSAPQPLVSQTSAPPVEGISAESIYNIQSNPQSQQSGLLQPTLAADATCIITTVQSKIHDSPSEGPPDSCLEKQVPAVSDVAPAVSVPSQPPSAPSHPPVQNSISPPPSTLSETSAATLPQPEESVQARAGTTAPPSSDLSSSHASAASSAAVSAPSSPGPSSTPPVARRPHNAFGNRLSLALGPTARRVVLPAKPVPRSRAASPAAPARQDIAPVPGSTGGREEVSVTAVAAAASEAVSSAPELEQPAVDIIHNGTTADDHCTADAEEDKLLISDTATQSPGVPDTQQPASTEAASDFSHPDSAQEAQQQSAASSASGSESLPSSPAPVRGEAQSPSRLPAEASEGIWAAPDVDTAPTAEVLSAAEDSADELISPKATAPVRKPPGLPSPVPSTHGRIDTEPAAINGMPSWADPEFDEDHSSWAEQDPIDDSSAWAEQDPIDDSSVWAEPAAVDDNSSWPEPAHVNGMSAWAKPAANSSWAEEGQNEAPSQSHSPIKADEASTTSSQAGQEAPMASETRTEEQKLKREETQLEQKLRDELKRIKGNSKPIDPNDAALRARLEKEAKQQFEQEHRHLKGKMRAAEKAAAERISKERLQQEKQEAQHARRRDERIAAAGVAAPSARHHSTGPYPTYPNSNAASSDGGYDAEEVRPHPRHAPKAYLDAEVRHVPAHAAPGHPLYEERPASNAALREGHVASRAPRAQLPFTRAQTQEHKPYAPHAANPLAFLGQVAPAAAPKANPDPLAFGVGLAPGVVHKHQFDRLAGLIEASRSQPYQEQERLRRELQTLMTKASRDRVPLPQADALMQDLKSAQDTRELLQKALNAQPVSISTLEHAIQAGRNCRLLNKDLVKGADTKLRELKKSQQALPRQQYAPSLMPPHTRPAYTPHRQTPTLQSAAPQPPKHIPVPQYVPQPAPKPQFVPRPYTPQDPPATSRYMPTPAPQQKPPKQEYMPPPPLPQQKPVPHYHPQQSATPQYQPAGPQPRATPQYQPQPLGPQQNPAQQNIPQQRPLPQYKPQQAPARQAPAPYMPQQASSQQNIPPQHVPLQPVPAPQVPPQPTAQLPVADAAQTRRQPAQEGHAASSTAAASTAAATAGHSKQPVQSAKRPPPGMPVRKGPQMAPSSDARAAAAAALSNLEPALARAATPVNNSVKPQPTQSAAASKSGGPEGRQDECVVCWAHEKDVVCIPCGHVAMCKGCSQAVLKKDGLCPVCRTQIREVFQLYRT